MKAKYLFKRNIKTKRKRKIKNRRKEKNKKWKNKPRTSPNNRYSMEINCKAPFFYHKTHKNKKSN